MSKVTAYHTDTTEYGPKNREVHHDHDDCYEGRKIEKKNKVSGTGGKPLCMVCKGLA
jgi:hypothetical protein